MWKYCVKYVHCFMFSDILVYVNLVWLRPLVVGVITQDSVMAICIADLAGATRGLEGLL